MNEAAIPNTKISIGISHKKEPVKRRSLKLKATKTDELMNDRTYFDFLDMRVIAFFSMGKHIIILKKVISQ
jgi:hypothetical protein